MSSLDVRATENEVEEEKMNNKGKSKQKQCNSINYDDSQFPDGMKVLAVDENAVCLKIITTLLHKCRYQVTAMNDSAKALMLLKQKEDNFDIVLTNVQNTGQINGFKLLEAGLELDIPVIMISAMEDVEIIKKGVIHGARHFLLKPVCLSEIKNIWQHVYRKNISKFPNIIRDGNKEDVQRKRTSTCIDDDNNNNNVQASEERKRIRWTQPLHAKFVDAVLKLGGVDKAVPTKILDIMKENEITREKVASHLQKYRKSIKNNFGADNHGRKRQQSKEETMATSHDQSILILPHIGSERSGLMGPTISRHHLPTASGARDNRADTYWSMNSFNSAQSLDIRPSQVVMQQQPRMVQLGGNFMGGSSLVQGNHQHLQQQQPQHHMSYGDFRSLYSDSIDLLGKQVTDEFDDWPLIVAPPPFEAMPGNGYSFDGELNNIFGMNS